MTDQKHEAKLKKAGADRVVSPNTIGALRMAYETGEWTSAGQKQLIAEERRFRAGQAALARALQREGSQDSELRKPACAEYSPCAEAEAGCQERSDRISRIER